jgi:hypothetical protein
MLAQLPCPTLGCGLDTAGTLGRALASHLDILVPGPDDARDILDRIAEQPSSAAALVELLRLGERLDCHGALIAESLVYSTLQAGPAFAAWCADRPTRAAVASPGAPAVHVLREGSQLELVLNRPERHNAFSAAMRDALVEGLTLALADAGIAAITLRGEGPSFCSGGDLDEFGTLPDPATAHAIRSTRSPARLLAACRDRVRAEIHGACVGAGIELPAFCSHVVAHPEAFFQLPEVGMGLVPGAGGTASLPRRIGRQRTAWLALSGRRLDAQTALAWGLVDEVSDRVGP